MLEDLLLHVRARYPILYLVTYEEERARTILRELGTRLGKRIYFWTASEGFSEFRGQSDEIPTARPQAAPLDFGAPTPGDEKTQFPVGALQYIVQSAERAVFVLHDFHPFLEEPKVVRLLRDVCAALKRSYKTLVFVSPTLKVPDELSKDVSVLDLPLPDARELGQSLRRFLDSLRGDARFSIEIDAPLFERIVQATLGLTESQAANVFAKALVKDRRFTADDLPVIISEKKQIIRQTGLLEYYEQDAALTDVGGLDELKRWLLSRREAFTDRAREYGLPQPKGLLLLGVQGCGKSLTAKAIASTWRLPLLRLDVGAIFSSFIGQSEANMRRAIAAAEGLAPVILWLDEIEKGFSGLGGGGVSDGGAANRVFGTFLTWLQEKTKPVFVVATSNKIASLPPEMLRKGRFDEIFFIDLPDLEERAQILTIHLKKRNRKPETCPVQELARAMEGFIGAEIEACLISGMYASFAESREVEGGDLFRAARETVSLSQTMREEVEALRSWARERARPASVRHPAARSRAGAAGGGTTATGAARRTLPPVAPPNSPPAGGAGQVTT
ncbi:MAG: AAA family ATPase [Planctomycetes bacterium]|nr:AAA family ATPase [Planctomycetota bacterium]